MFRVCDGGSLPPEAPLPWRVTRRRHHLRACSRRSHDRRETDLFSECYGRQRQAARRGGRVWRVTRLERETSSASRSSQRKKVGTRESHTRSAPIRIPRRRHLVLKFSANPADNREKVAREQAGIAFKHQKMESQQERGVPRRVPSGISAPQGRRARNTTQSTDHPSGEQEETQT